MDDDRVDHPVVANRSTFYPTVPYGIHNADWIWFSQHAACDPGQTTPLI